MLDGCCRRWRSYKPSPHLVGVIFSDEGEKIVKPLTWRSYHNLQVFWAIIRSTTVLMVYIFKLIKWSAKHLLHYPAVFTHLLTVYVDNSVSCVNRATACGSFDRVSETGITMSANAFVVHFAVSERVREFHAAFYCARITVISRKGGLSWSQVAVRSYPVQVHLTVAWSAWIWTLTPRPLYNLPFGWARTPWYTTGWHEDSLSRRLQASYGASDHDHVAG